MPINQYFMTGLLECAKREFGASLAAAPAAWAGGVQMDHYKGLASALATRVVPFYRESYEATEFVYGYIPVKSPVIPRLFFQITVLDVKGNNIPGVASLGAVVRAAVPESCVAPLVGFSYHFLPVSAVASENVRLKDVLNNRVGFTPFLDAVNGDKPAVKALNGPWISQTVSDYKIKIDIGRPIGLHQLAPYKGYTLFTMQTCPGPRAKKNAPYFDFRKHHEDMQKIVAHLTARPQRGEEVGMQFVMKGNEAMLDLMVKQIDAATAALAGAAAG